MLSKKLNIIGINGSASQNASNLAILKLISENEQSDFNLTIIEDLTEFPHFKTELTSENTPPKIIELRSQIENADGVIICTPEYVFSIPSGLKNILEWCVSTTVFSGKSIGIITASTNGEKAHDELQLIMNTLQANFTDNTTLLIQGVKGKISKSGKLTDAKTENTLNSFIQSFRKLITV